VPAEALFRPRVAARSASAVLLEQVLQKAAWHPQAERAAAQSESAGQRRAAAAPELVRSSVAVAQARRLVVVSVASAEQAAALRPGERAAAQGVAALVRARAAVEEVARQQAARAVEAAQPQATVGRVWAAAVRPPEAAWAEAEARQREAALHVVVLPQAVPVVPAAVRPSVAPWACHRDRLRPWLAPQPAARSVRAR
jgi:hypothetical protein